MSGTSKKRQQHRNKKAINKFCGFSLLSSTAVQKNYESGCFLNSKSSTQWNKHSIIIALLLVIAVIAWKKGLGKNISFGLKRLLSCPRLQCSPRRFVQAYSYCLPEHPQSLICQHQMQFPLCLAHLTSRQNFCHSEPMP